MKMQDVLIELIRDTIGETWHGVEVGVFRGTTSVALLEAFPLCVLEFVDPWREWQEGSSYRQHKRTGKLTQEEWDKVYQEALARIEAATPPASIPPKFSIHRMTSAQAALLFNDAELDLVFIDANHTYEHVKLDIHYWMPKIKKGGLICGHDYCGRYRGVKKAVDEVFDADEIITPGKKSKLWGVQL